IANHNLMSDTSWFFPAFAASRLFSSAKHIVLHVGTERWGERSVEHLSLNQPDSPQVIVVPRLSHLTQMDLYLDSNTLLPARLTFNAHPDNDVGIDIPVEIVFSDYRSVNGVQVAFHIQKSINNSLALDFQAEVVEFNTNLTSDAFSAQ